ncbi:hypothetical protein EG328_005139 [Venturia inaequalis]|uniref:Uncharacterized protein n=1 Tax=Venturia inaequalis TaxID=5025 RepID=A0A8H3UP52_VENIN|nr:hypothetical protein EG328_005139 [Venturia inaequalis]KAE9982513.1 hypothetical protein EG327_005821 [Venturia inaequalis]RDI76554.1 hypothetical protein Vi05172_g13462 [Venturia inaequalis]
MARPLRTDSSGTGVRARILCRNATRRGLSCGCCSKEQDAESKSPFFEKPGQSCPIGQMPSNSADIFHPFTSNSHHHQQQEESATGTTLRDLPCDRFTANHDKPPASRTAKKVDRAYQTLTLRAPSGSRKAGLHPTAELADMHAATTRCRCQSVRSRHPICKAKTGNSWPNLSASFKLAPSPSGAKCVGSLTCNSLQSFE